MDYIEEKANKKFFSTLPYLLAKFSFLTYFFFVIFGRTMPFQEVTWTSMEDMTASNPINQYVFSFLYVISFFSLLSKKNHVIKFVLTEKFFSLFLLWSFFSIFWSDATFVSFKRWLQFFGTGVIFLAALMHFESIDDALGYLKLILIFYIPVTLLSILAGLGVSDWGWVGLTSQKNVLGQISLVSLIIWSIASANKGLANKIIALMFWCLSFILLIGSKSVTCYLTAILLTIFAIALTARKVIFQPIIGRLFSFTFLFLFFLALSTIICFNLDILDAIFLFFGRESTFSGRIDLWASMFKLAKENLLLGSGFGGFWVVGSPAMELLYKEFPWFPNQAHLGYLDIFNETGLIGLLLFVFMVFSYFLNLLKVEKSHLWKWFVICVLLLNFSESTFITPHKLTGVLFIYSYLALFTDYLKLDKSPKSSHYVPN
jgi:O-antigen ligase